MYWILVLVIALIVHGSLYPWQFHARALGADPLTILLHSWPVLPGRFLIRDIALNIALYVPLGVFGYLAWARHKHKWLALGGPVLLGLLLSSSIEMAQLFDRTRLCSLEDVLTNTAGAMIGVLAGLALEEHLRGVEGWFGRASKPGSAAPLVLLGTWVCWQLYPFFPSFSRYAVFQKLGTLPDAGVAPLAVAGALAGWLAAGRLLEAALGRAASIAVYVCLLALVPLKLLIAGRTLTFGELIGATVAATLWLALPWESRRSTQVLAAVFLLLLAAAELEPFHFARTAGAFNWKPFDSLVATRTGSSFLALLRKAYWYGSAVWLLRASGLRLWRSAGLVAAVLAVGEAAQVYLPGRTPETTDPVLALLMAFAIAMLDRRHAVKPNPSGAQASALGRDEIVT